MPSNLMVFSPSTRKYMNILADQLTEVAYKEICDYPNPGTRPVEYDNIYAIGGGRVIDYAKILAGPYKSCIAIPTTAAGASETAHAVIWDFLRGKKINFSCLKPVTQICPEFLKDIPGSVLQMTYLDALSHAWEVCWSHYVTPESRYYAEVALTLLDQYDPSTGHELLILAGIYAGKAIQITGTNVIHACSYPLTLHLNIPHGIACGFLLRYFRDVFVGTELPRMEKKGWLLNKIPPSYPSLRLIDPVRMAEMALQYDQVDNSSKPNIAPFVKEAYQFLRTVA